MDDFDVFASKPSATEGNTVADSEKTDVKVEKQQDNDGWFTENTSVIPNPADIVAEDNLFPSDTPVDDITSSNVFDESNTVLSDTPVDSNPSSFDPFGESNTVSSDVPAEAIIPSTGLLADDNTMSSEPLVKSTEKLTETLPPTVEDIFGNDSTIEETEDKPSYNVFPTEGLAALHAINKKREQEIAEKDADERAKIEQLRQQAKSDLERWYNERQRQMEQKRQTMKNEENELNSKAAEKSTKESCDWSKVIRLVDFTDGTQISKSKRDLTRMKSCIFTAKRISEKKKVANGV